MTDVYKQLGFKQPDYLENQYGIRIYIGTIGKNDWCVEIPKELVLKELVKKKCNDYGYDYYKDYDKNFVAYFISETFALEIAKEYTQIAKE